MNPLTTNFKKINFNTFQKSYEKSQDNIDPGSYCYNDITLNNFETTYLYKVETKDFPFDCFISIPCNYHFNRYLFSHKIFFVPM